MFIKALLPLIMICQLAACSSSEDEAVSHLAVTVTLRYPQEAATCLKAAASAFQVKPKVSTAKLLKVTTRVTPGPVFDVFQVAPTVLQVALVSTKKDKGSEDSKRNIQAMRQLTEELAQCGNPRL